MNSVGYANEKNASSSHYDRHITKSDAGFKDTNWSFSVDGKQLFSVVYGLKIINMSQEIYI
ncbi:hypothetical protein RH915_02630 [Serpentinicella sp. ANB-PHB4]|uniref:hypothetical protein n=1 Tax=Serpentinicella sp. ANB-PHB4 TaxID=3074076 RepID=UPI0028599779|nr:hypothetical protein [Serpentinicella sp. ANB-PHB4]MDR5658377.1 hypothetical protein [Serpentinicella sp. ANB-PHB4]